MGKSARLFRVIGAAALLISMLAALVGPVAAQQQAPDGPAMDSLFTAAPRAFLAGANAIYFPWVANDDDFGLGPADTTISVQNLEDRDSQIWLYTGNGDGTWSLETTAYLSAFASKTFSAAQLGYAPGEGGPVAVIAANVHVAETVWNVPAGVPQAAIDTAPSNALFLLETPILLSNPITANTGGGETTQVLACVVNYHTSAQPGLGVSHGYVAAVPHVVDGTTYAAGAWVPGPFTDSDLQTILNDANAGNEDADALVNPFGGLNADGDCLDLVSRDTVTTTVYDAVALGGVAKMAVEGETLPYTTSADTAVSGYNALNGLEVSQFNEWSLPIVQTNCGPGGCWDSMIRVANLSTLNSAVTIRFFPADDGSGSLQTGFQVQQLVNGGDTWHVNLGDLVPEGWVGSAHIYSDGWVFPLVDRYKAGYSMWLTNTGSAANFENVAQVPGANGRYALFAPHVLMDWFGWNTGINVANLVEDDNNVSIQYFNMLGNATQVLNQRLAAHGMTYFYDPSVAAQNVSGQDPVTDPNAGVVGSAIIWSDHPVAVAVDATKYPETDPRGGVDLFQATSYNATQNVFTWQAVPLVQKGNPADGMGATSGINIMNPNATAATANVYFVNPSGFNAQNFGVSSVTIPAFANGFVYTLWQHNLPNGFVGSAQVVSNVPVVAVSANVDYQVDGDGSAIYNAFNPCGLYRTVDVSTDSWQCFFGDPFDPSGRSVTKTFVDEANNPIEGVQFHIVGDNPDFPYQRNGVSGVDGSVTFTNVPVGTYELNVDAVPMAYLLPENPADEFTLRQGQDWAETNTLLWNQGITKTVVVAGSLDDDGDMDLDTVILTGVNVSIYENIGATTLGTAVAGEQVYTGVTDTNGQVETRLAPGNYLLCLWDADQSATTPNGETVTPDLPDNGAFGAVGAACELVTVVAGIQAQPVNEVEIVDGVLNIFVGTGGVDGPTGPTGPDGATGPTGPTGTGFSLQQAGITGQAGIEVCLYEDDDTLLACTETNSDGFAEFPDLPEGDYTLTVQADGLIVVAVDGGEDTVSTDDVVEDGVSMTAAVVTFHYDPTADLAQDGWLDDVDGTTVRGTVGLTMIVGENDTQVIEKTVTLNGEPVAGVTVTIAPSNGAGNEVISEPTVVTGANGIVIFVVTPGVFNICSTVDIVLNPEAAEADQVRFDYEICDEGVVITETYEIHHIENNHETVVLTKQVTLATGCIDVNGDLECDDVAPYDGDAATVSLTIDDDEFGPFPVVDGEISLTIPGDDTLAVELCSTIDDPLLGLLPGNDELCEPVDTGDAVNGTLTIVNQHHAGVLGQVDVWWDNRIGGTFFLCLGMQDTDILVDCIDFNRNAPGNSLYFKNVPDGNYYVFFVPGLAPPAPRGSVYISPSENRSNVLPYITDLDVMNDECMTDVTPAWNVDLECGNGGQYDFLLDTAPLSMTLSPGPGQGMTGQLDVGWSETYVFPEMEHPDDDTTWCLYDSATPIPDHASFEGDAVQCVFVEQRSLGYQEGIFFTDIPHGTYYLAWNVAGQTIIGRTVNELQYQPLTDILNDGFSADIPGGNGYGLIGSGRDFDFLHEAVDGQVGLVDGYGYEFNP